MRQTLSYSKANGTAHFSGAACVRPSSETLATTGTLTDEAGYYFLPSLFAGNYRVRCEAAGYQSQQLELPVAGRIIGARSGASLGGFVL